MRTERKSSLCLSLQDGLLTYLGDTGKNKKDTVDLVCCVSEISKKNIVQVYAQVRPVSRFSVRRIMLPRKGSDLVFFLELQRRRQEKRDRTEKVRPALRERQWESPGVDRVPVLFIKVLLPLFQQELCPVSISPCCSCRSTNTVPRRPRWLPGNIIFRIPSNRSVPLLFRLKE